MRKNVKIISRVSAVALALIIGLSCMIPAFAASIGGGHRGSQYWGIRWKNEVDFNYTDAQGNHVVSKMGSRDYGGLGLMNVHYFALNGQSINRANYAQRAFCIEPEKNIEGVIDPDTSYNYVYDATGSASYNTNTGLSAYDSRLQPEKKKLLNYVLANGYGNYVPANAAHVAYWYATQLLIYEVVAGRRTSGFEALYGGFNPTTCLMADTDSNTLQYVPGGSPETSVQAIQQAYNDIVGWVKLTLSNPDGTSDSSSNCPTHTMTYNQSLGKYVYDYSFNNIIRQDLQDNSNFAVKLSKLNLRASDLHVYDSNNRISFTIDKTNKRIRFTANSPFSGSIAVAFADNPRIRGINESLATTAQAGLMIVGYPNSSVQAFARGASKLINRPAYFKLTTSNVEKVKMKKVSANPDLTTGNSCYSLAGAVYGLYNDAACTSLAGSLVTDANGNAVYGGGSGTVFGLKNLWAKEISPSPGYLLDANIYPVTNSGTVENGVPVYSFTSTEIPDNDPITVFLKKQNAITGQSGADLAGAIFKVSFYDGDYTDAADVQGLTPLRTWYFETDNDGKVRYDTEHLSKDTVTYPSDELYIFDGEPALPNGSLSIQEVKAPTNYKINPDIRVDTVENLSMYTEDQEPINPFVVNEVPVGGLTIQKTSSDGIVKDVWFRVQGDTGYQGGYNKVFKTNDEGFISIKNDPDMYVTNGSGQPVVYTITELGFSNGDGTYTIPARYTPDHISQTTTIDEEGGVTVKFKNQMPTGMIAIDKAAEDGYISSVYFQVTGTNGYSQKVSTNTHGTVYVRNLPVYDENDNLITYTVKELGMKVGSKYRVPERYETVDDQYVTFANATINSNNLIRVNFNNELKYGSIKVHKSADDGDINGVYFRIENNYADKSDDLFYVNEIVKTTGGVAELTDLPVFDDNDMKLTYTVTELGKKVGNDEYEVPGYYFEVEPQTVKLDASSSTPKEVSFENKVKFMNLVVTKTSTDNVIENVWFHIVSSDGELNDYFSTDEYGEIIIEDLYCVNADGESVTYTITEMGVKKNGNYVYPAKYYSNEPQVIEGIDYVPASPTSKVEEANADFYNIEKEAAIRVNKFSEDNVVEGVWFRLTNSANNKVFDTATLASGIADFSNLKVYDNNGNKITYTVTELGFKQANGTYQIPYRYNSEQPKTLTLDCNETDPQDIVLNEVDFENTLKKGSITINKKDNNGAPLAGVTYELHKSDGTLVSTKTTTSNGVASFTNLDQGNYYIVETKTVAGFNLLKDKIDITVSGESNETLNVTVNVKETLNFDLPNTGENGIMSLCIGGGIILIAGIIVVVILKIKKKK